MSVDSQESQKELRENSSSELVKKEKIEGTPFDLITYEDKGVFVAIGKLKLTPFLESKEQATEYLEKHKWEFTLDLILAMIEAVIQIKEQEVRYDEE